MKGGLVHAVAPWCLLALVVSMTLCLLRIALRSDRPTRIIALDLFVMIAAGVAGVSAVLENAALLVRVALVLALVSFLGTVGLSFYVRHSLSSKDAP